MRVLAALSGGVDSAVAAARALDAGHDVTAVHLALSRRPARERDGARGCCTLDDARDARRVADVLGLPFFVWDLSAEFADAVIDDFVAEYAAGRTPNPCVRCNERIKFAAVLDRGLALGFDAVCTGHYARLVTAPAGVTLHRAVDEAKDQSYVLAVLPPQRLAAAMFPLGDSRKPEVRAEAAARGLLVAEKPDSHDVCFIPDGDTAGFLRERLGAAPGPVVDAVTGERLGTHDGAHAFTVGQRRGLRLRRPAGDGAPRYVVEVDVAAGQVLVGPAELLAVTEVVAADPVWCGPPPDGPLRGTVQLRAHGAPVPATVEVLDGRLVAGLDAPVRGVAPGQTVVVYDGTRVVGSATIERTGRGAGPS